MKTKKTLSRRCVVCEAGEGWVLHRQRFVLPEGHPLAAGYEVVCCANCGFAFADTAVPQSAYDEFYARFSKYDDASISTGGGGNPSDVARLRDTAQTLAAMLPREARVLDIGCAGGGLLDALRQLGFTHLTGLDPSSTCVDYGRREFGLEMHQGTLDNMPQMGRFDAVVLSHVMEHVQDVRAALHAVHGLLAENGALYIEVPDAMRYTEFLIAPFQDFNTEHINHFSDCSLRNLAASCGWTAVEAAAKTIESTADVPYPAIWQLWRKNSADTAASGIVFDAALQPALEAYIAGSQQMLDAMNARLKAALDTPVAVWGTGQLAMKLLAETVLGQSEIAFWIDANPVLHGHQLRGAEVLSPTEGAARLRETAMPVVIASTIHAAAITARLRNELNLEVPVITL